MTLREQTGCFTGHRRVPPELRDELYRRLTETVDQLAVEGVRYFGTGGALGFDELAAQAVLACRNQNPAIRLIVVLPCPEWDRRWPDTDRRRYAALLEQADKVVTVSPAYDAGCMHHRNRYLVDHSDVCIGWGTGETGGTAYTMHYAEKQGLRIIRFME